MFIVGFLRGRVQEPAGGDGPHRGREPPVRAGAPPPQPGAGAAGGHRLGAELRPLLGHRQHRHHVRRLPHRGRGHGQQVLQRGVMILDGIGIYI